MNFPPASKKWTFFIFRSMLWCAGFVFAQNPMLSLAEDPFQQAVKNLSDKDPQIRRRGAETLGQLRNSAAANDLVRLLSDPVPMVRVAATDSLGLMRSQAAGKEIVKLLETDKDPSVRQTAAIALGYIADRATLPALVKGIKDRHEGTRFACINSLGILRDSSAVDALANELKSSDSRMRNASAYALGNINDKKAIPALISALKLARSTSPIHEKEGWVDPLVGATIVRSLGLIGDPSILPALAPYLEDKDKKVRIHTAQTLSRFGSPSGLSVAREALNDSDSYHRRISIELLGEFGESKDLRTLKGMKGDPDRSVDQAVASAIEKLTKKFEPPKPNQPKTKSAAEQPKAQSKKSSKPKQSR